MTLKKPDFDYSLVTWFDLAPLLFVLRREKLLGAEVLSFTFGYLYGFGSFYWLPLSEDVSFPQFIFLIVPTFALYYLPFGLIFRLIYPALGVWILIAGPAL